MLHSIFIGQDDTSENVWKVQREKEYNCTYFVCESIKQRIRLWKHTPAVLNMGHSSDDEVSYKLADNTFFSNNYKNMAIMLMKAGKGRTVMPDQISSVVYVTLFNRNYKLLRYQVVTDNTFIVQTYRNKDMYQGCVLGITKNPEVGKSILDLDVIDYSNKNLFTKISIVFNEDGSYNAVKHVYNHKDKLLSGLVKKYDGRILSFKMTVPESKAATNTFITTEDNYKELDAIINRMNISDSKIIVISDKNCLDYLENIDNINNLDKVDAVIDKYIEKEIIKDRVRAITTFKLDLPYKFCKQYKVLYLFKMDENGKSICLRSN